MGADQFAADWSRLGRTIAVAAASGGCTLDDAACFPYRVEAQGTAKPTFVSVSLAKAASTDCSVTMRFLLLANRKES